MGDNQEPGKLELRAPQARAGACARLAAPGARVELFTPRVERLHSSLLEGARTREAHSMAAQEKLFESHVAWVASLRVQYDAMGAANPPIFLHERFNDAIDFEPPVYRSSMGSSTMTDSLSWQSVCDDLDFDVEPTVYRSLAAAAMPDSRAAWMQSLPPLVQRQRAFVQLSA